ncbi:Calcineurin-like metallo-phosphoesterase superfamily protein [Rhynchospora pubera]|uniref:Calcineurin-like metallo-phosphoesterase superfamily protein n=1 Tax=Rhynchospora pubera TaxID=906938 RepID=A0AAV8FK08_9POAL|nr:Calcineurin-like metallo-phosphoesterase superfamily protein [Rhynchospora pubera]
MERRGTRRSRAKALAILILFILVSLICQAKAEETETVEGAVSPPNANSNKIVSRIAFGSCFNQSAPQPQPIWESIIRFDPQVFIWLGDNIYGDNKRPVRVWGRERTVGPWKNIERFFPSTEDELSRRYAAVKSNPGYARLRQGHPKVSIIGTWDDHDYGLNDAGKEFPYKDTSQQLLLDFLDEPHNSPRRKQAGVYASYMFGPPGKRIKVILLDMRYHRDPLFSDGTILGETQWSWLEKELNGPQSEITIIASSIQVVSNLSAIFQPLFYMESWSLFPKERRRLFNLIDSSKREGVMFISGDVHFGEITRDDCGAAYPVYDLTSSGLTQAVERTVPKALAFVIRFMAWIAPSTKRVFSPICRFTSCTYGLPNFGAIEIDWEATPPMVKLEVRNELGKAAIGVEFTLSNLRQPEEQQPRSKTGMRGGQDWKYYKQHCLPESELPWFAKYRIALILVAFATASTMLLVLVVKKVVSGGKMFIKKFKVD